MKIVCIIPVHMESKRFPGKPLAKLDGKPLIQHVYERCWEAGFSSVIVAYCDKEVGEVLEKFGRKDDIVGVKTPKECRNGTERCFIAAKELNLAHDDYVINVQGDEVMIDPVMLSSFRSWVEDKKPKFATIALDIGLGSFNAVKISHKIQIRRGRFECVAEDFFRTPIYSHVGVYAYSVRILELYNTLPRTSEEKRLSLEQLRFKGSSTVWNTKCTLFIYEGCKGVVINTKEDLRNAKEIVDNENFKKSS